MQKQQERNHAIDLFRVLCAVLVIAFHTYPLKEYSPQLGYLFSRVLTRIAVPFFFAVSGYYGVAGMLEVPGKTQKTVCRLLRVYLIWSAIYMLIHLAASVYHGTFNAVDYLKYALEGFFLKGAKYHLWYFPAVLFAMGSAAFLVRLGMKKLIVPLGMIFCLLGSLGSSYFEIGTRLPLFGRLIDTRNFYLIRAIVLMGFPYFTAGYLVWLLEEKVRIGKRLWMVWAASAVWWLSEAVFVNRFHLCRDVMIAPGLYAMVVVTLWILVQNPLPQAEKLGHSCHVTANFMYFSHPIVIMAIRFFAKTLFYTEVPNTLLFLLTVALTALGGWIITHSNSRLMQKCI